MLYLVIKKAKQSPLLREISIKHPEKSLEDLQRRVNQKLSELKKRFSRIINQVNALGNELR